MLRQQHRFFRSVLMGSDLVLIVAAAVIAYFARFYWLREIIPPLDVPTYQTHAIPVEVTAPLMLLAMMWCGLYKPRRDQSFDREFAALFKAVVLGVGMTIIVLSLFRNILFHSRDYSGWQFVVYGVVTFTMLVTWRYSFRQGLRHIRRRGWNQRHVAIIGTGRLGQVVFHTLNRNSWTGIKPGFFISHLQQPQQDELLDVPVAGGIDDLEKILENPPFDLDVSSVMIALPGAMAAELSTLLYRLERFPVDVRVVPDVNPRYMPINFAINTLDGMPVLSMRQSPLSSGWGRVAKRSIDIVGAVTGLIVFALPMIMIAILVRRSGPGPVIFRQPRMSLNGQRFDIFKFRTMVHVDAEQQAVRDAGRGIDAWTQVNDPRITKVGKYLRRTSLDELPQLFNVLLGEMSLVGPRPERAELIESFREDWRGYMLRQNVKAGMTGWAQVNGLRGQTSLRKRLQYDLFYIRNWSLLFDLRILWMTIFRGFVHPSAQ